MQRTNKEVLIVIVSLIIVILAGYVFIFPTVGTLREQNYNVGLKKDELKKSQEHLANLNELESLIDQKKNEVNALNEALPNGPDVEDLVATLDAIAKSKGMTISTITPELGDEETAETGETAETVTASGFKIGEMNVLKDAENSRRIINVKDVSISAAAGALTPGNLVITLSVSSYYLNES
jgi:Tfp pilus assembly protein PilO